MKPLVSVIIPTFNSQKHINKCLKSILNSSFKNFELIVIDDCSSDNSQTILKKYQINKKVVVYYFKKNFGPAVARNFGASKARGKYLIFLDIDTQIDKNCLTTFVRAFEKDKNAGAFQAKIINGNSKKLETAGHFLSPFGFPYEIGVNRRPSSFDQQRLIFGARSAGMAVKKQVFNQAGGFDSDYLIYGEETDLCWRIWLAGYKIYFLPWAIVYHFQKSSLGPKTKYRILYQGAKNNISNIIKNAPLSMITWMILLHIFCWLLLSLGLILKLRLKDAYWILKGIAWNIYYLPKTLKKRKGIQKTVSGQNQCRNIIFGQLSFVKIIKKGLYWITNV